MSLWSRSSQAQSQMLVDNQVEQTVSTQTIIQQIDDTIEVVTSAAQVFQEQQDSEKMINRMNDLAVLSLNMLAINCEDLYKEKDKKTIKLAKKRAFDGFAELESKNKAIYQLIEPHRNFINAALGGQKNLRYKKSRVTGGPTLFEKDPASINKAFSKIIHSNQEFDKQQEAMKDPKENKRLAAEHESDLKEYENDDKYKNKQENVASPKQRDLYFTESGKKSQFINKRAVANNEEAKQAIDKDLYGSEPDVYDEILSRPYLNAVLTLSSPWNGMPNPCPCLILVPKKEERAKQDKNIITIRPCYPYDNVTLPVTLKMLQLDPKVVRKYEESHIKKINSQKMNDDNRSLGLGYRTIEEIDTDNEIFRTDVNSLTVTGDNENHEDNQVKEKEKEKERDNDIDLCEPHRQNTHNNGNGHNRCHCCF